MLPGIMGIMLNTVDENLKTTANSIANTSFNLFGFLPSPYVYGLISDVGDVIGGNKRAAMKFNMTLPAIIPILIIWQAMDARKNKRLKEGDSVNLKSA